MNKRFIVRFVATIGLVALLFGGARSAFAGNGDSVPDHTQVNPPFVGVWETVDFSTDKNDPDNQSIKLGGGNLDKPFMVNNHDGLIHEDAWSYDSVAQAMQGLCDWANDRLNAGWRKAANLAVFVFGKPFTGDCSSFLQTSTPSVPTQAPVHTATPTPLPNGSLPVQPQAVNQAAAAERANCNSSLVAELLVKCKLGITSYKVSQPIYNPSTELWTLTFNKPVVLDMWNVEPGTIIYHGKNSWKGGTHAKTTMVSAIVVYMPPL